MSDKPLIDVPQVLEDLQAVVAEKGDGYVYESPLEGGSCVYRHREQPSCIVGHVLARNDLLGRVSDLDNERPLSPFMGIRFGFTREAAGILRAAQTAQDSRETWGDALIAAKEAAVSS